MWPLDNAANRLLWPLLKSPKKFYYKNTLNNMANRLLWPLWTGPEVATLSGEHYINPSYQQNALDFQCLAD